MSVDKMLVDGEGGGAGRGGVQGGSPGKGR